VSKNGLTPRLKLIVGITVLLAFIGLAVVHYAPRPPLSDLYPHSTAVYARHGELLRLTLAADGQYRLWLPLREIPEHLRKAAILYEDRQFYRHPGIDPQALLRAVWATYLQGRREGGSTLTMQLARQLYRIDSRGVAGKARQIVAAVWLEMRYRKDELLEAYLNTAPYGGNIVGVGAASLIYFHKPAARLTLSEALALAVVPQNPLRRFPSRQSGNALPQALLDARQRLWQRWLLEFPGDGRYAADFALPLTVHARTEKPFFAPHVADYLLRSYPNAREIRGSIDLAVQKSVERLIENYLLRNRAAGLRNATALLLDTGSMQVKALAGSADFWNADIAGQVNGALAKRSPGSTLKPFVYALAIDQGLVHPQTVLADAPTTFGPFSPENFDGRFIGPVTVQDALIRSRNIPAISVAAKLSQPNLYQFLQNAGIAKLAGERHYGLALALGGGEVTMEELAQLYALLANGGALRPLRYVAEDEAASERQPVRLLSAAAAFITLDMLSRNPRPDSKRPANPKVAWKTGTSWGFRDAWTVGVAGRYVLAVWVGNFDGSGNPAFVGLQAAAPLFFALIDGLRAQRLLPGLDAGLPAGKPDSVAQIEVCAGSGDLPNRDCPARVKTWFIPGTSPIKVSTLHRAVFFDRHSGAVVCEGSPDSRREVYEFWPSEMSRLFTEAGMPRRQPPPLPSCYGGAGSGDAPRILSPSAAGVYTLRIGKPATIGLRASGSGDGRFFWFADKSYIGKTQAAETLSWTPNHAGQYRVQAVDSLGRAASRDIRVEFAP
jgi:penicillin-binding protein 1C